MIHRWKAINASWTRGTLPFDNNGAKVPYSNFSGQLRTKPLWEITAEPMLQQLDSCVEKNKTCNISLQFPPLPTHQIRTLNLLLQFFREQPK